MTIIIIIIPITRQRPNSTPAARSKTKKIPFRILAEPRSKENSPIFRNGTCLEAKPNYCGGQSKCVTNTIPKNGPRPWRLRNSWVMHTTRTTIFVPRRSKRERRSHCHHHHHHQERKRRTSSSSRSLESSRVESSQNETNRNEVGRLNSR